MKGKRLTANDFQTRRKRLERVCGLVFTTLIKEQMEELTLCSVPIFMNPTEIFPTEKVIFRHGIRTSAENNKRSLEAHGRAEKMGILYSNCRRRLVL
jgi:hypothetical protein